MGLNGKGGGVIEHGVEGGGGGGVIGGGLIGLEAKTKTRFAYLHISIQYIKYSLVFFFFFFLKSKKILFFFSFFSPFFKFPGLVKNLTA